MLTSGRRTSCPLFPRSCPGGRVFVAWRLPLKRRTQALAVLTTVIAVALSFGGCQERREPAMASGTANMSSIEESNDTSPAHPPAPPPLRNEDAIWWGTFCRENGQVPPGEPPFCAMYRISSLWTAIPEKEYCSLVIAVWPDGRIIRSHDLEQGGPPLQEGRIDKWELNKLEASLDKTHGLRERLLFQSYSFADQHYWVIELKDGTRFPYLDSGHRQPDPEVNSGHYPPWFCDVWDCCDRWFARLDLKEPAAAQKDKGSEEGK
jgi:hypothetical protein